MFQAPLTQTLAKLVTQLYAEHADEDGFLYFTYDGENTLGQDSHGSFFLLLVGIIAFFAAHYFFGLTVACACAFIGAVCILASIVLGKSAEASKSDVQSPPLQQHEPSTMSSEAAESNLPSSAPHQLEQPAPTRVADVTAAEPAADLSVLKVSELRGMCKSKGLSTSGNKEELIARLSQPAVSEASVTAAAVDAAASSPSASLGSGMRRRHTAVHDR